jgi:hypothetical protein
MDDNTIKHRKLVELAAILESAVIKGHTNLRYRDTDPVASILFKDATFVDAGMVKDAVTDLGVTVELIKKLEPNFRWLLDYDNDRKPEYGAQVKLRGENWKIEKRQLADTPSAALFIAFIIRRAEEFIITDKGEPNVESSAG